VSDVARRKIAKIFSRDFVHLDCFARNVLENLAREGARPVSGPRAITAVSSDALSSQPRAQQRASAPRGNNVHYQQRAQR
jgi:hypothetical protein